MLIYSKLWLLLKEKGMKRTDLLEIMSSATLAKLGKNDIVSSKVISEICDFLDCQPCDIMENCNKKDIIDIGMEFNKETNKMLEDLSTITGQTKKELLQEFIQELPTFIEKLQSENPDIIGISELLNEADKNQ